MAILASEFASLYHGDELPPLKIQYKDFSNWQNNMLQAGVFAKQEAYWLKQFSGDIPILNMPLDFERPPIQSFEGYRISFMADEELSRKLYLVAAKTETTLYMVLLAAYTILLSIYSGQDDIIIGTPTAGRPHVDLQNQVGMFVNTLSMRNRPKGEKSFREFLKEVKGNALDAYENQDFPVDELINKLKLPRDISRNPLYSAMFLLQNMKQPDMKAEEIVFSPRYFVNKASKSDLILVANEVGGAISFIQVYCIKLFREESITKLTQHYISILKYIGDNIEIKISEINLPGIVNKKQTLVREQFICEFPADVEYVAPRDDVEKRLCGIWCELLEEGKPGVNNNFFELGGNSLKAVILLSKIEQEFGIKISLVTVFREPTISGISIHIKKQLEWGK
jgi:acyl carrier protein